jgi:hypothetical protein
MCVARIYLQEKEQKGGNEEEEDKHKERQSKQK